MLLIFCPDFEPEIYAHRAIEPAAVACGGRPYGGVSFQQPVRQVSNVRPRVCYTAVWVRRVGMHYAMEHLRWSTTSRDGMIPTDQRNLEIVRRTACRVSHWDRAYSCLKPHPHWRQASDMSLVSDTGDTFDMSNVDMSPDLSTNVRMRNVT